MAHPANFAFVRSEHFLIQMGTTIGLKPAGRSLALENRIHHCENDNSSVKYRTKGL
jgi:hypothetical protein